MSSRRDTLRRVGLGSCVVAAAMFACAACTINVTDDITVEGPDGAGDAPRPDGGAPPATGHGPQGMNDGGTNDSGTSTQNDAGTSDGGTTAAVATSCLALLDAQPGTPTGVYTIDPGGAASGSFPVYCDMDTEGGGWTFLPLRFADPAFWSITQPGNSCITIDVQDDQGDYRQYFSSQTGDYSNSYLEFVPPIPVSSVRFVQFLHTNGGAQNTMDFAVGGYPSASGDWEEGWDFVDPSLGPVGYTFATGADCVEPYEMESSTGPCSRDYLEPTAPTAPFTLDATVTLSETVPTFDMGLVQGCGSAYLTTPLTDGEQFHIASPPDADGIWRTGIAIR